jgi:predicted aldo/keto reductase-like oxidoreductase
MKIDTVDVIQMHGMKTSEQVEYPVVLEAFEELKKAGKARFLGVTTHSNQDVVINKAVEMGYFDVVLVAYNFMSPRAHTKAIANAAKANIGVVIMKALKPLKSIADHADHPDEIYKTSLRWILANENVANIIPTMRTIEEAEQDVSVVATKVSYGEIGQLEEYAQLLDGEYCRMCGICSGACPQGVAADDIIRYASYYTDYGDRDRAMGLYRNLAHSQTVDNCNRCGECSSACPYDLGVVDKLERAHALLA